MSDTAHWYCVRHPEAHNAGPVLVDKGVTATRDAAKATCESDGMHLPTIREQADLDALMALTGTGEWCKVVFCMGCSINVFLNPFPADDVWLGAWTAYKDGLYAETIVWQDAGPPYDPSTSSWLPTSLGEWTHCVQLHFTGGGSGPPIMDDTGCGNPKRVVCMAKCGEALNVPGSYSLLFLRSVLKPISSRIDNCWTRNRSPFFLPFQTTNSLFAPPHPSIHCCSRLPGTARGRSRI